MSLAQQLLLRALVARFWDEPYDAAAGRAGARELHDRFMLPHFVGQDFDDVLDDLRRAGYRASSRRGSRRTSSSASRCSATSTLRGVELELRQALEPWHVLGEERRGGGTARYVDSSVERLQVKVTRPDRRAPRRRLQRPRACRCTRPGTHGEFVAGVRYRAWQPPSRCTRRSACTRRSSSTSSTPGPAARSAAAPITSRIPAAATTTRFPVNAYEAESRRLARFFADRPHAGPADRQSRASADRIAQIQRHSRFTLDLRRDPGEGDSHDAPQHARLAVVQKRRRSTTAVIDARGSGPRRLPAAGQRIRRAGATGAAVAPSALAGAFVRVARRALRPARAARSRWDERARAPSSRERRHLQRLRRSAGRRPPVGARPAAASWSRPTNGRRSKRALDPARAPARRRAGRPLRPADAARGAAAAADAGPRQPAFPAALPRHRRQGADPLPRPLRRRPGARSATAAGACWPTAPRRRRAPATRSRTASCWRAACPRRSATSRCATCGRSSTAGTIR